MLIVEHNPKWAFQFEKIKEKYLEALKNIDVQIEHIGGTSVPLLAAKNIIDIDIIFMKEADFESIKQRLEVIGYIHKGNQGIAGREVFKRNGLENDEILDNIPHHLYLCKHESTELQRHILFRNYLKANETARNFYQNLKQSIALEANNDRKRYTEIKEIKAKSFIDFVIELAKKYYE
jgi:GrpB-like predicted nucleotidyltransferase (UPF0157 family)